jgi:hypothetical protein
MNLIYPKAFAVSELFFEHWEGNVADTCKVHDFHDGDDSECSFGLRSRVDWLVEPNVSEKRAASIFRDEDGDMVT